MTTKEMQNFLQEISNNRFQTKVLNAILSCFELSKMNEKRIQKLEEKVNELISAYNKENGQVPAQEESAEALNYEMQEDSVKQDIINEDQITPEMEENTLIEKSSNISDTL